MTIKKTPANINLPPRSGAHRPVVGVQRVVRDDMSMAASRPVVYVPNATSEAQVTGLIEAYGTQWSLAFPVVLLQGGLGRSVLKAKALAGKTIHVLACCGDVGGTSAERLAQGRMTGAQIATALRTDGLVPDQGVVLCLYGGTEDAARRVVAGDVRGALPAAQTVMLRFGGDVRRAPARVADGFDAPPPRNIVAGLF